MEEQRPAQYNDLTAKDIEKGSSNSTIDEIIASNDVIMFSKSTCPFCYDMKNMLVKYGVIFSVFEVDQSGDFAGIKAHLTEISSCATFPNLFVKQESIGGCTDLRKMEHSGELYSKLGPFIGKSGASTAPPRQTALGLLWFPEIVDAKAVRLASAISFVYSIICIGFNEARATKWAVLGLALDYLLRFVYGGSYSVAGTLAALILSRSEPHFVAAPPKQFASFCGLFMSFFAAALFVPGENVGGSVVLAGLVFASGLEAIFDFCLGCFIFSYALSFGLVSPSLYTPSLELLGGKQWFYDFNNRDETFKVAENSHVLMPWQTEPTPVDLIRKDRPETEYKNVDFDMVRHTRVDLFAIPMTGAALGFMFLAADEDRFKTNAAAKTLGIISAVLWVAVSALYLQKFFSYPKKVFKEWAHPIFGNYFSTISICITLFGILLNDDSNSGGAVLLWIGGIMQMLITVLRVSDLVYDYIGEDMLNPSLMMAPVGNFICAVGFARYANVYSGPDRSGELNYVFIGRLWFSVAALFAIVLFTITFKKALHDHHSDNRLRSTLWIWLATSSIAGPAFQAVSNDPAAAGVGILFQSLWCISLVFFTVNSVGLIKSFYTYQKDTSIWIVPFSLAAFAASTVVYDTSVKDDLFFGLSAITIAIACASAAVCALMTMTWASDLSLFKPRPKWGPVSFMKLTHECFRFAIPKMIHIAKSLQPADVGAVERLVGDMEGLFVCFMEHSKHEDEVIFPRLRRYFPDMNLEADEQHEATHELVARMEQAIADFRGSEADAATAGTLLEVVNELLQPFCDQVLPHLRQEECTFTTVARKYLPLDEQISMALAVFEVSDVKSWRKVFGFMLSQLPSVEWKVTYLKTFVWANPARAQEIGLMVYHSADSVTWLAVTRAIPQLIPRGLPGHKRIY